MATAKTRTMLSLDRYAKIMGINPAFFNGGGDIELADGSVLFPVENNQNQIWPQYSWQNADMVSREDLAMEIAQAEQEIVSYLGYYPVFNWTESERHFLPRHFKPELSSYRTLMDVGGNERSVRLNLGYFMNGGRRSNTLILANALVTYVDADLDGWEEQATVTVPAPGSYDSLDEIRMYFPGNSGEDGYEIRDFISKKLAGNNIVFTLYAWMLVNPNILEALPTNSGKGKYADFNNPSSFVQNVDIYRVFNDDSQPHVKFHVPDMYTSEVSNAYGFLYQIDNNFVVPVDGSYSNGVWTRDDITIGYADYADLWYYSGIKDTLSDDFAQAIAYLATARLEKVFYANNNATALAANLREYMNESEQGGSFKMAPPDVMTNPFGTKRGEWMAWRRLSRYKPLRNTGGSL
jgi:hypothetical protein